MTEAAAQTPEPLAVLGVRPARGGVDGPSDTGRAREARRLAAVASAAIRQVTNRDVVNDAAVRTALGARFPVAFQRCRGKVVCVGRLAAKLKRTAPRAVFGDYAVVRKTYAFRFRLLDVARGKVVKQVAFKLAAKEVASDEAWQRELAPLLATEIAPAAEPAPDATPAEPTAPATPEPADAAVAPAEPPATTPPAEAPAPAEPATAPPEDTGVPELAPITTDGGAPATEPATAATTEAAKPDTASDGFIDTSVLDAISRGITWHGHLHNYTAVGARGELRGDWIIFEDRLQLEFETDIAKLRIAGKPQLVYDAVADELAVRFRELYARREYERFDLSVGEQIVTWGVTDFWPVVDIINPRDFTQIRNWRPIDEKLPVPMLQSTVQLGPVAIQLLGVPILRRSAYDVDQTRAFAVPVPAPTGTTVEQESGPPTLWTAGGGVRVDVASAAWKLSLYGLVGRDPLPSVRAEIDLPNPTRFVVDNDRVAMAAVSVQGKALGVILRAEAAGYHRLDDACEGKDDIVFGVPECFYLRRVPTARANVSLERRILPGLDAHVQLIPEYTRSADIPPLPSATDIIAPGLPEQYGLNRIATLRLQGDYLRSDFRPMAFAYASLDDESMFVNVDLEYHVADGFALALGGFWFKGFASDPDKDRYTLAGSFERASNVYLRATAWF